MGTSSSKASSPEPHGAATLDVRAATRAATKRAEKAQRKKRKPAAAAAPGRRPASGKQANSSSNAGNASRISSNASIASNNTGRMSSSTGLEPQPGLVAYSVATYREVVDGAGRVSGMYVAETNDGGRVQRDVRVLGPDGGWYRVKGNAAPTGSLRA